LIKRKSKAPTVYVLAGPNGAGKTTFAADFLPGFVRCHEFLNADMIAAGLAPFAPETQNLRAGRLLLERIEELVEQRAHFGFETTLSGRTYVKLLKDMKKRGYRIELFFLWLPDAESAVARVEARVREGGHNVPSQDVRRRYAAGLRNLFRLYLPIVDGWSLYDSRRMPPAPVAAKRRGRKVIVQPTLYKRIEAQARELDEEAE
jgi:predicted ABC-type ATPase